MKEKTLLSIQDYCLSVQMQTALSLRSLPLEGIEAAKDLIQNACKKNNRLHITGIGKPGHLAAYFASLLSSTGTPTYFLHGTEAVHGSCGQLERGDVVIVISNSGETVEMRATVLAIQNNGCAVIGVSGSAQSWLAAHSAVHLLAPVDTEGGPLSRAPRNSIASEAFVLQVLSIALQSERELTPQEYVLRHPGGSLGNLREGEASK